MRSNGTVVDLLVVGGGVVGAWAAYSATRAQPGWSVVLAERGLIGSGTTRYSLAFSLPLGRNERVRRMAAHSAREYLELSRETGDPPGRPVSVVFVTSRLTVPSLLQELTGQTADSVRILDAEAKARFVESFPGLRIADHEVIIEGVTGWYADPVRALTALARRVASHRSAEIWEGTEVCGLHINAEVIRARFTDGGEVFARRAIIATGPKLVDGFLREEARERALRVKKIVALHVQRCPRPDDPVVFFPNDDAFLLPVIESGQWLFSFTSTVWDCPADPSNQVVTEEDRTSGMNLLHTRWPELATECTGGRASCDSYAADWTPLVDTVDEAGRVVLAGGCSGSGWRLAPAIGCEAVKLIQPISSLRMPSRTVK